jgi:hypothetical protein
MRKADSRADMAMLDRLAGLADQKHSCGYEDAVLRGPQARVSDNHAVPLSACCVSLESAKAALDAVSEVIWIRLSCIVCWMAWRGQLSPSSDSAKCVLVCLTWGV